MATIQDLGKVAYLNKGVYNSETTYEINDVVSFNGSSYVSKTNENRGNLPTNTIYWSIVASKGDKGETGKPFVIEKTYMTIEAMVADYDNMNINDYVMISGNIEEEQNATLWTKTANEVSPYKWVYLADFSGASGITGATPNIIIGNVTEGNQPAVTRRAGSSNENPILDFILKTGPKGDIGDTGNGISSIEKTGTSGLVDTYTITYTDGTTSTFQVTNGEDAEITPEEFEELQNEVNELKDENQRLKATLSTTTGTGENITLDKTAEMEFVVPPLPRGNTSQNTTEGYNLLLINDLNSVTYSGMEAKISNQIISINGTSTSGMNEFLSATNLMLKANQDYTVVTFVEGTTSATGTEISTLIGNESKSNIISIRNKTGTNIKNYTFTEDTQLTGIRLYASQENLTCDIKVKLMVVEGTYTSSTIPAWEEYTNGASPNPDYPQEVQVVKGSNVININNQNYFPNSTQYNGTSIISQRCTVSVNDDEFTFVATGNDMYLGTASTRGSSFIDSYGSLITIPPNATNIYLKCTNTDFDRNYVAFYDNDKKLLSNITISNERSIPENAKYCTFRIGVANSVSGTTYKTKIMASFSIIDEYIKYKNQVLPIDLPVENLFDGELELGTIISGTGETGVSNNAIRTVNYIAVNPNTTYILSNNKNYTPYVFEYNSSKTYVRNSTTQVTPYTFTTTSTTKYIKFRTIESKVENDLTTKFMLELGSKANAYTPYGTTPIELCKIGDYQDYFYKDNGKWYLHKETKKVIFDGSENWLLREDDGTNYCYSVGNVTDYKHEILDSYGFSNYFDVGIGIGYHDALLRGIGLRFYSALDNNNVIYLVTNNVTTVNNLKDWLTSNNVILYYALATPTNTEITDTTLINQLEAIYNAISYEGQTNISGTSGGENPIFDVEAYQNTKLILENLDNRLSLIEG